MEAFLQVDEGPPIPFALLSPFFVNFLESVSKGIQHKGLEGEAFGVLEEALAKLTDPMRPKGLSQEFVKVTSSFGKRKGRTEAEINADMAKGILLPLINGFSILNASHEDAISKRTQLDGRLMLLPWKMGWQGLALGNTKAWYGEIDMLICHNSNAGQSTVAVVCEEVSDSDSDSDDEELSEADGKWPAEERMLSVCETHVKSNHIVHVKYCYFFLWTSSTEGFFINTIQSKQTYKT
ncbi:hypothetical protein OS493_016725 [Desmophyllum pertusum]|uniref:Uncharacterized protein n=1 Tax=Desmophyllum pertusum TaxID=174260 RepID=A0A9X0CRI6_9CNID|nr:hypothetical protein OS493_016725 [Desmophyllum pertusum]